MIFLSLLSSCELFRKKEEKPQAGEKGNAIARVLDKYLYIEDLEGFNAKNYSKEDSAEIVRKHIDAWVLKQLLAVKAESVIDETQPEVSKRLEETRNSILIYEFEKEYLRRKLDTSVTERELRDFYHTNIQNFELKQNIFKGCFIKLPKEAPESGKIKDLLKSEKKDNDKELKSFCVRYASHYILEDSIWLNFDDLIKNTPFREIQDKGEFLEKNRYKELSDDNFIYLIKIKDYKISKEISPYEFVKDQIRNHLINNRRMQLIAELKKNIYSEALKNNEFEIYSEK